MRDSNDSGAGGQVPKAPVKVADKPGRAVQDVRSHRMIYRGDRREVAARQIRENMGLER